MKNNKRYLETLAPHFQNDVVESSNTIILTSPNDTGVIRNGGRNGTRYAPEAIINNLKRMSNHLSPSCSLPIAVKQICGNSTEKGNEAFNKSQDESSQNILELLNNQNILNKKIIHIGGGHDHVYPLLKSIDHFDKINNILVLNIDAHCDTRIDDFKHSGTPFRNFTDSCKKKTHIIQYGIHNYANSKSTLTPLKNGGEKHYFLKKIIKESDHFQKLPNDLFENLPIELGDKTLILLSLDCDAINSSQMEAVSAVNPEGLPLDHLQMIIDKVLSLPGPKIFGIYEYNPIFENLSQKGSRAITALIYNWLSH